MLHPDGLILATGTEDNGIRIWDLKTQKNVATFQGHKGGISAVRVRSPSVHPPSGTFLFLSWTLREVLSSCLYHLLVRTLAPDFFCLYPATVLPLGPHFPHAPNNTRPPVWLLIGFL